MANNLTQLATDIKTAFGANLDATTIAKVRDRFVAAYQAEWLAFLAAGGLTDTAANRNTFAVTKVMDYIKAIYTAGSVKENEAAVPAPDVLA